MNARDNKFLPYLELQFVNILFPVCSSVYTGRSAGSVEADSERRIQGPSTDINLSPCLIRENQTTRAENIGLDVHFTPRL